MEMENFNTACKHEDESAILDLSTTHEWFKVVWSLRVWLQNACTMSST